MSLLHSWIFCLSEGSRAMYHHVVDYLPREILIRYNVTWNYCMWPWPRLQIKQANKNQKQTRHRRTVQFPSIVCFNHSPLLCLCTESVNTVWQYIVASLIVLTKHKKYSKRIIEKQGLSLLWAWQQIENSIWKWSYSLFDKRRQLHTEVLFTQWDIETITYILIVISTAQAPNRMKRWHNGIN